MTAYPYQPPSPPSRRRNMVTILMYTALLLICCGLASATFYVVIADPFDRNLTARLALTATPTASPTSTRTITSTQTSTRVPTPTSTPSFTPPFTPTLTSTATPTTKPTFISTVTASPITSLTICMASEPSSLFIYGESSYEKNAILDAIQDGPIDDRTYEFIPVILEQLPTIENGGATVQKVTVHKFGKYVDENDNILSWGGSERKMDQIVVTFRLKEGLYWSNGKPLTADDAQFGYEIARDITTSASDYAYLAERTASFKALNDRTVQWVGLPGYIDPNYSTFFFPPVSRQAYGSLTPEQIINDQQANTAPLGWGPFRIVAWNLGTNITLERNPFYFRASEGLPYLDKVIFRFVPDDDILAELTNGSCDVAAQDYNWGSQLEGLRDSESTGAIVTQYIKDGSFEHIDFNLQPINRPLAILAYADIRQAVAYCLDRQAISNEIWYGHSSVPDSFIPPNHPLYNPDVTRYEFDPQRGLAMLKAAGWEDHNGDKILDQNGQKLTLSLYARSTSVRERITTLIAQQLIENCGIDVTTEFHTREELFSTFPDGLISGRQFDLAEFYWSTTEGWQTCDLYTSTRIPTAENPSGENYSGFSNPEYDNACEAGMQSLTFTERLQNYRQAQTTFSAELPSLPLFWQLKITVTRPPVAGLILDPSAASEFWNIEQAHVLP